MQFVLSHDRRAITDEDILADLRRVAADQAESNLKQRTYKEHGRYGVTTAIRRFSSWNEAVLAAGLSPTVERNIPHESLFEALFSLWAALGRQPNYSEVQAPRCKFSVTTFERRFGSWRGALESFVEYTEHNTLNSSVQLSTAPATRKRTSRTPDLRLRFRVLARDNFRCRACGASPAITPNVQLNVDHINAWSFGGETTEENLQTLCFLCNQGKSNVHPPSTDA